jgi:hypothetical protein
MVREATEALKAADLAILAGLGPAGSEAAMVREATEALRAADLAILAGLGPPTTPQNDAAGSGPELSTTDESSALPISPTEADS